MKWLMYRDTSTLSSHVSVWHYKPLFVDKVTNELKEAIEEEMQEEANKWYWSEHFRRIEWKIVDTRNVSHKAIKETEEYMQNSISYHREMIEDLEIHIPIVKDALRHGRKTDPDEIDQKKREIRRAKAMRDFEKRQRA